MKPFTTQQLTACALCAESQLDVIWTLLGYPFTEQFGVYDALFPASDLNLVMCPRCGHVQLLDQVCASFLYNEENYGLTTQNSPKIDRELEVLATFIETVQPRESGATLEFGANNLRFARVLAGLGHEVLACDPLVPNSLNEPGITTFRGTIEELIAEGISSTPHLVVARHTLEHIADPVKTIASLFDACSANAVLVFEVPSLEHLTAKLRFDAVIYQHYHYFTERSVQQLAAETDSVCIASAFNERGSNGGSLLFALARPSRMTALDGELRLNWQPEGMDGIDLRNAISQFEARMQNVGAEARSIGSPIYGFGASLMLATQNYHMRGAVEVLHGIFDDDPTKSGTTYKNVDVVVHHVGVGFPAHASFLVTSLENTDSITKRLRQLKVQRVLAPLG